MYRFRIWQLKEDVGNAILRFSPFTVLKEKWPDKERYDCVYEEEDCGEKSVCPNLEAIFVRFQHEFDPPKDFKGHSLSVSDIITIDSEGSECVFCR